jgi:tetratricopeptide (TPR) repeat protein
MTVLLLFVLAGARALLENGDAAFNERRYEAATGLYVKAHEQAKKEGDRSLAAEAAAQAARGYLIRGKKEEGRPWLAKAKEAADDSMPKAWSRYLGVRGRFEWKDEKLETATKTFEEMYAYCEKHGLHDRAVDAAHMVAITGTPEQQIEWARKGIAAAEKGKNDGWLGPLWNNLGYTYQERGEWKQALECYRKARHYHWKLGRELNKLAADWAVGKALRHTGEIEKAMCWLRPVLAWAERLYAEKPTESHAEWIGSACLELGFAQLDLYRKDHKNERLTEAIKLLRRALEIMDAAGMEKWDPKGWKELNEALASVETK